MGNNQIYEDQYIQANKIDKPTPPEQPISH